MQASPTQTLDTVKQKFGGIFPGFNFLRHALAFTILAHHTRILLRGEEAADGAYVKGSLLSTMGDGFSLAHFSTELLRPFLFALVGAFFALSGFLVADSAFRTRSLRVFLVFRILRILPALLSEVTLSAFLLGAFITTLPLRDYFSHSEVYAYLENIVGNIHFYLPGVFTTNPIAGMVNANLWTLPSEFHCYLILSFLMLTGIVYSARNFTILFVVLCAATVIGTHMAGLPTRADSTHFSGWFLIYYFFIGVLFASYAKMIPVKLWLFIVCGAAYVVGMLLQISDFISGIFLTYCTVYIGTLNIEWFNKRMKSDYSYGFYLYGYPITQTLIAVLMPLGLKTIPQPLALVGLLVLTFSLTACFATVSWKFIEKPFLGLKRHFIKKP